METRTTQEGPYHDLHSFWLTHKSPIYTLLRHKSSSRGPQNMKRTVGGSDSDTESNALALFDHEIISRIGARRLCILLDYDGTLTPIVADPSQALLSSGTRVLLTEVAELFTAGVVTGRSLAKISSFVDVGGLYYAASHGFDIRGPQAESIHYQVASDWLPTLRQARDALVERVADISGAEVEDNVYAVSVHYRNCPEERIADVEQIVEQIRTQYPLRRCAGKMVFELRPDIRWDKGEAVIWLLQTLEMDGPEDIFTICTGGFTVQMVFFLPS
jgi:trehalose-phosphatase